MPQDLQQIVDSSASSFDPYSIFIGLIFGMVGWCAWRYGRKAQSGRHMLLGVALMAYAYFVPNPWWSMAAGSTLTAFLFWPKI